MYFSLPLKLFDIQSVSYYRIYKGFADIAAIYFLIVDNETRLRNI